MCQHVVKSSVWRGVKFWLYMHPKVLHRANRHGMDGGNPRDCHGWACTTYDLTALVQDFLRKNNTGKLLWQVFGPDVARLCIFGVLEQEEYMWDTFRQAGRGLVSKHIPS